MQKQWTPFWCFSESKDLSRGLQRKVTLGKSDLLDIA